MATYNRSNQIPFNGHTFQGYQVAHPFKGHLKMGITDQDIGWENLSFFTVADYWQQGYQMDIHPRVLTHMLNNVGLSPEMAADYLLGQQATTFGMPMPERKWISVGKAGMPKYGRRDKGIPQPWC